MAPRSKVEDTVGLTQAVLGAFVHHHHYHPEMSFDPVYFIYYVWSDLDKGFTLNNSTLLMDGLINGLKSSIESLHKECIDENSIAKLSKCRKRSLPDSFVNNLVSVVFEYHNRFNLSTYSREVIQNSLKTIFEIEFSESQTYSTVENISSHLQNCINFLERFQKVNFNENIKVVNKGDLDQWLIATTRAFPRLMEAIDEEQQE